ncbi:MAG: hypothetical protein ABFR31_12805 [Thermodesulfobacteriota bacterium]
MEKLMEKRGNKPMKKVMRLIMSALILSVLSTALLSAAESKMKGHDMAKSDKIGDLIHESVVEGYMLSYYFMDLRDQKSSSHTSGAQDMDKPHHIMVYIMDKNHNPVLKAKVGFLIKDADNNKQKAMGMFMSNGFGATCDMKKRGSYTIITKVVLENRVLKDSFNYEIN